MKRTELRGLSAAGFHPGTLVWWLFFLLLMVSLNGVSGETMAQEKRGPKVVVMLGDSLTAGRDWQSAFPEAEVHNHGVPGDTVAGVWSRLDAVAALNPDLIFLQIGINNLGRGSDPDRIMNGHLKIWREIRERIPEARLLVISLLPISNQFTGLQGNRLIVSLNHCLRRQADDFGLDFIDLHPKLLDREGQLRPDFTNDGLHLLPGAYQRWEAMLRPYIDQ